MKDEIITDEDIEKIIDAEEDEDVETQVVKEEEKRPPKPFQIAETEFQWRLQKIKDLEKRNKIISKVLTRGKGIDETIILLFCHGYHETIFKPYRSAFILTERSTRSEKYSPLKKILETIDKIPLRACGVPIC